MNTTQVASLKSRIASTQASVHANFNAHNAAIVNRASRALFSATGEVFAGGSFLKTRTGRLIDFVKNHSFNAVALPDGRVLCEEQYVFTGQAAECIGFYGPYWTPVDATVSAVRDWLGY